MDLPSRMLVPGRVQPLASATVCKEEALALIMAFDADHLLHTSEEVRARRLGYGGCVDEASGRALRDAAGVLIPVEKNDALGEEQRVPHSRGSCQLEADTGLFQLKKGMRDRNPPRRFDVPCCCCCGCCCCWLAPPSLRKQHANAVSDCKYKGSCESMHLGPYLRHT